MNSNDLRYRLLRKAEHGNLEAVLALLAETVLAPQHGGTQRPLGPDYVEIRRFHAFMVEEGP